MYIAFVVFKYNHGEFWIQPGIGAIAIALFIVFAMKALVDDDKEDKK